MTSKEYLKSLPPSSVNNDRQIMRTKIERTEKFPSEHRYLEIENISQGELQADFLDRDLGNEPKKGHEPHYQIPERIEYDNNIY